MSQNDVWYKVSVATIKQLRASSYAPRRRGSFLRGKDIKRREDVEKIDEDGGTPRRDRIEMVGDWNPRGESLSRGEKQTEWRRLSDRAYSPLCFRSQAWPAGERFPFFFPVLYTQTITFATYMCAWTRTHTHIYLCMRAFPSVYTLSVYVSRTQSRPFSTLVAASWTFPFDFHDTALGAVTRALRFFLLILSFPRSRVRLLHIRRVRELYYVTDGYLSICHEEMYLSDFVRIWRTLWFDIDFSNQRDNFDKFKMYRVQFSWTRTRML